MVPGGDVARELRVRARSAESCERVSLHTVHNSHFTTPRQFCIKAVRQCVPGEVGGGRCLLSNACTPVMYGERLRREESTCYAYHQTINLSPEREREREMRTLNADSTTPRRLCTKRQCAGASVGGACP